MDNSNPQATELNKEFPPAKTVAPGTPIANADRPAKPPQGQTLLQEILGGLKAPIDAFINGVNKDVPVLSLDALNALELSIGPRLDVPAWILDWLKGYNGTIQAAIDPMAQAELELLEARVNALL